MGNKIIIWLPRILSLGFAVFLSLFALDVFQQAQGFEVILPLFIHLLPALILLALTIVSWKRPLIGAIAFFAFALLYIWQAGLNRPWSWYATISGPALIIGTLYLVSRLKLIIQKNN